MHITLFFVIMVLVVTILILLYEYRNMKSLIDKYDQLHKGIIKNLTKVFEDEFNLLSNMATMAEVAKVQKIDCLEPLYCKANHQ